MKARLLVIVASIVAASTPGAPEAQGVPLEYQVKAAYLYNFVKYVDWPTRADSGPIVICVAGRNPFGDVLAQTVDGETFGGRPIEAHVILEPEPGCHVLFVPEGAATSAYLRASRGMPTLTVGESRDFIDQGGIIGFFLEEGSVRFAIDVDAAQRAQLSISSRLLRLGRRPERRSGQ